MERKAVRAVFHLISFCALVSGFTIGPALAEVDIADIREALVIRVIDADTVGLLAEEGKIEKHRLLNIDCPEKGQPWGKKAKRILSAEIEGLPVLVKSQGRDKYKRHLSTIFLGEKNLNRWLVETGHCWVFRRYNSDSTLLELEKTAKDRGLGLWSLPEYARIPPWEFRRKRKSRKTR
jgi:endonuclease YncB( thermonuclease family)